MAREGQGYPCYQHDVMMMMMHCNLKRSKGWMFREFSEDLIHDSVVCEKVALCYSTTSNPTEFNYFRFILYPCMNLLLRKKYILTNNSWSVNLNQNVYIYIYICVCVCVCVKRSWHYGVCATHVSPSSYP